MAVGQLPDAEGIGDGKEGRLGLKSARKPPDGRLILWIRRGAASGARMENHRKTRKTKKNRANSRISSIIALMSGISHSL